MLRIASTVVVGASGAACAVAFATAAWAAPSGRVVRVERPRQAGIPRACVMAARVCLGKARPGEQLAVIDPQRQQIVGTYRIDSVSDEVAVCPNSARTLSSFTGSMLDGDTAALTREETIGIRGLVAKPAAMRVLANQASPSGRSTDHVMLTLDTDGNGRADLMLVRYSCDERGQPSTATEHVCVDTYGLRDGKLARVHQDLVEPCS